MVSANFLLLPFLFFFLLLRKKFLYTLKHICSSKFLCNQRLNVETISQIIITNPAPKTEHTKHKKRSKFARKQCSGACATPRRFAWHSRGACAASGTGRRARSAPSSPLGSAPWRGVVQLPLGGMPAAPSWRHARNKFLNMGINQG